MGSHISEDMLSPSFEKSDLHVIIELGTMLFCPAGEKSEFDWDSTLGGSRFF